MNPVSKYKAQVHKTVFNSMLSKQTKQSHDPSQYYKHDLDKDIS